MGTQISIFDGANKYVNDKPIRLIEAFAGSIDDCYNCPMHSWSDFTPPLTTCEFK